MKKNFKVIIDKPVIKPLIALLLMVEACIQAFGKFATTIGNFFNVLRHFNS